MEVVNHIVKIDKIISIKATIIGIIMLVISYMASDANAQVAASSYQFNQLGNINTLPIINEAHIFSTSPPSTVIYKKFEPTRQRIILPCDTQALFAGQCVCWIKYVTGLDFSGDAIEWRKRINSNVPKPGFVAVMKIGKWGHLGRVESVTEPKEIIRSRNWEGKWIVSDNEFYINDPIILGYIDPGKATMSFDLFSMNW